MNPPGQCFTYVTSRAADWHALASGLLGMYVATVIGLAGLFAVYLVAKEGGRLHASLRVATVIAVGTLITLASAQVTTAVTCENFEDAFHRVSSAPEKWAGVPAYFVMTQSETSGRTRRPLAFIADVTFWSGAVGFAVAFARRRRPRRTDAELRDSPDWRPGAQSATVAKGADDEG